MKEPAAAAEEEVLRDYLAYYAARGAEGKLAVCDEASLKARARRLLGQRRRGALDVCSVAERCRRARGERGGSVLRDLLKALEVLELLCVSLLLFPWRKEIRSLKVGQRRGAGAGAADSPGRACPASGPFEASSPGLQRRRHGSGARAPGSSERRLGARFERVRGALSGARLLRGVRWPLQALSSPRPGLQGLPRSAEQFRGLETETFGYCETGEN